MVLYRTQLVTDITPNLLSPIPTPTLNPSSTPSPSPNPTISIPTVTTSPTSTPTPTSTQVPTPIITQAPTSTPIITQSPTSKSSSNVPNNLQTIYISSSIIAIVIVIVVVVTLYLKKRETNHARALSFLRNSCFCLKFVQPSSMFLSRFSNRCFSAPEAIKTGIIIIHNCLCRGFFSRVEQLNVTKKFSVTENQ